MAIPGKLNINIGLQNESIGSDSLYTAFNKTKDNFDNLFSNSSSFTSFYGNTGISVTYGNSNTSVDITNTGVTSIIAGTGIVVDRANGNVTISSTGGGNGSIGTVTSVGVSSSTLSVSNTPIISAGNIAVNLPAIANVAGTYSYPFVTVDGYGRITSISNATALGTVTSVGITPGEGIQVSGGPITTAGNINVINTGVTRLNAGAGIALSGSNGNVTVSTTGLSGTVTSVGVSSTQLVVTGSPVTTAGTIAINLPNSATFSGNVTAANLIGNRINANSGIINGNLTVTGNISPAAAGKVGGIKPGPGVDVSLDGELTIDTANLPLSFGNFTANNNVLSIVNVDEDMILQTEGNAEIQLIGNIGFYKPDGLPPNVANRYFSATSDGQIQILVPDADPLAGAVNIIGSTSGNFSPPVNTGVMLQLTGQANIPSRFYNDGIGNFAAFVGRRINGSVNSPTPVQAGDELIRISATGYNGTQVAPTGSARIVFQAMENFTTSNAGSNLSFWTAAVGSNALTKIATIDSANGIVATKISSTETLNVTGNANVGNLGTSGVVIATGNVTGGNLVTGGALSVTGNANVGNLGTAGQVIATGNVTGGNLITGGSANVTGNVNAGNIVLTTGNIIYTPRYGSFYSNVHQTNPVANTAMAMTFNNTATANGVSVVSNSQLTIAKPGVYNIQFSAQVAKTGGGTGVVDIWLNKNGTPVDWTNTSIPVTSGTPAVAAWNFVENVTVANTYFQLMWSSPDTGVLLDAVAANTNPTRPGIPSVIVTVTPVGA